MREPFWPKDAPQPARGQGKGLTAAEGGAATGGEESGGLTGAREGASDSGGGSKRAGGRQDETGEDGNSGVVAVGVGLRSKAISMAARFEKGRVAGGDRG